MEATDCAMTCVPLYTYTYNVGGESGSADTVRDPRGFAVKFYTEDGNWDLVGNNTPIFFIRDPILVGCACVQSYQCHTRVRISMYRIYTWCIVIALFGWNFSDAPHDVYVLINACAQCTILEIGQDGQQGPDMVHVGHYKILVWEPVVC